MWKEFLVKVQQKFQKKTSSWVKTTSLMQFFSPKIAYFFRFENIIMLASESEFFAAIHLENWDFSRQMFFSDHQWKIRLLGDHPLGSYKQGTTPFTVFCVDSDELSNLFPSSYVTLQKKDIFAQLNPLEDFRFSFRATLNFTNMIVLVVFNID